MAVTAPDVVIVDPCIRRTAGHYASYAAACREGLEGDGRSTICWAHRDVEPALARSLGAVPVFANDCWHEFVTVPKVRFVLDPPVAARAFLHDAQPAWRASANDPVLFAPTVDHRQLLAWAWWLRGRRSPRHVVLMLRYSYADASGEGWVRSAAWARLALRILRRTAGQRVTLATDSTRLAEEFAALGAEHVAVLPIPHTTVVRRRSTGGDSRPRLVMLGDARTEKGFAVLCDAIAILRGAGRVPSAEFVVQANIESPVYAHLAPVRERLRTLGGVTLAEHSLSAQDYDALLASADIVLLPYDRGVYRARTSGPFAEALAAGTPVVCTADTWMSDQLSTHGAGELFSSGDPVSLADAIERGVRRLPELTATAEQRREAWIAFHSPANFARVMREVVS